jgi:hypothetical protein
MDLPSVCTHGNCKVRNGNLFKMRVSEIRIKQIPANQGVSAHQTPIYKTNLQIG